MANFIWTPKEKKNISFPFTIRDVTVKNKTHLEEFVKYLKYFNFSDV